ncbi:MAG: hypothetical protein JFR39_02225 [Muribaculaceae bacterium]|jgi:hypothetical protein|nr:hypothetical protein [Muribaculaceae bacterium]
MFKNKSIRTIVIVALVIAGWFVSAHFFGPDSKIEVEKRISRLQNDSIALQGNFAPKGRYSVMRDILADYDKIKDFGRPLRFGSGESDSIRMFSDPRTSALAHYNIAKCDSVLNEVSPMWRATAALTLGRILKSANEYSVVKMNKDYENNSGIEIYSTRYLSNDEIEKDAKEYNRILGRLGFKSVFYSLSPETTGLEYTFD